jgi:ATP-dependent Clp protease ATP-binding subunit ClpB
MYGARPLKRLVQKEIGDGLARLILRGEVQDGQTVAVRAAADGDGLVLSTADSPEESDGESASEPVEG